MRKLALSLFLTLFAVAAVAALQFPALTGRVVDDAHILSPGAVRYLSEKLAAYENGTGNQVVVTTVASLQGDSVEDYSNLLFRHWALGQKGKDNGVLLAVAPNERKVHIEVGYRLEPLLTDAASSEIANEIILPAFREGEMERGIVNGTQAIMSVLGGHAVPLHHHAQQVQGQQSGLQSVLGLIFMVVFMIFAVRHPFLAMMFMSNARFGSSYSRDSDWGNDDGGFHGGGGSAGGGGASGSW